MRWEMYSSQKDLENVRSAVRGLWEIHSIPVLTALMKIKIGKIQGGEK